jgi:glycosyltransferase involved in cell wall biosynthesis
VAEAAAAARTEVGQGSRNASPLVSVVIPAYNCAPFIGETLDSVYRQTYGNWEVIVIDDGSTDETRAALAPHIGRIRYLHQQNRGTAAARNAGVRQARGELIAFLDHDDVWLPEKLELQVHVMQTSLECGLVFTDGKIFTADGIRQKSVISSRLDEWIDAHRTEDMRVVKGDIVRNLLFCNEIASASSVMVRRECFDRAGGFDEAIAITDDYDLWLRIARAYPVALIQRCLYMWRWYDESQSGPIPDRMQRWWEATLVVMEKHLPLAPSDLRRPLRAHMARQYWQRARYYFDRNQFLNSRKMLVSCLRHNKVFLPAIAFLLASRLDRSIIEGMRRMKRGVRTWRRVAGRRFSSGSN